MACRDWIYKWVEVEGGQIGIFGLDENNVGNMIPRKIDFEWIGIVQVGKSDTVLGTDRLTDDDLIDVIELIPVFVVTVCFFYKWFKSNI